MIQVCTAHNAAAIYQAALKSKAENIPPLHQTVYHCAIQPDGWPLCQCCCEFSWLTETFSADWAGWAEQRCHSREVSITSGAGSSRSSLSSLMALDQFVVWAGSVKFTSGSLRYYILPAVFERRRERPYEQFLHLPCLFQLWWLEWNWSISWYSLFSESSNEEWFIDQIGTWEYQLLVGPVN